MLPQKFAKTFAKAGLNIEEFTIPLEMASHRLKPNGVHIGKGIENWNGAWDAFLKTTPNPSREQILEQLTKMRKDSRI